MMCKSVFVLSILVAVLVIESSCQGYRIIRPTYRPPTRRYLIRVAREASRGQPQWLYKGDVPRAPATGDHSVLPKYIDSIKLDPNRRYARSLDSPSAKRGGGGHSTSSSRDTDSKHPGYNRRNAREIRLPFDPLPRPDRPFGTLPRPHRPFDPFNPIPRPGPRPLYPIYARLARDVHDDEEFDLDSF